jgi:hypothetical protein
MVVGLFLLSDRDITRVRVEQSGIRGVSQFNLGGLGMKRILLEILGRAGRSG